MLGRALGGEAQHGYAGIVEASNALGGLRGADGNLRELVGIGHGRHGHVAHHEDAVLAVFGLVGDEEHRATDAGDARRALDDLQGRTQGLTRSRERTGDLSVGTLGLDDHTTQIERVLHEGASLLDGHALALTQFAEQLSQLLAALVVLGIDERSLVDVFEVVLLSQCVYLLGVTDEDDVGQFVGQSLVSRDERALLFGLGEHDALRVGLRACDDFFNKCHAIIV